MICLDFGPCNCSGDTSGSQILTAKPEFTATPSTQSKMSLSASEIQKWFFARRSRIGSFRRPPLALVIKMYLHCPIAICERSRGVSIWMNFAASGPVISTCRSTATSHRIASFTKFQKFYSGSPKSRGIYI